MWIWKIFWQWCKNHLSWGNTSIKLHWPQSSTVWFNLAVQLHLFQGPAKPGFCFPHTLHVPESFGLEHPLWVIFTPSSSDTKAVEFFHTSNQFNSPDNPVLTLSTWSWCQPCRLKGAVPQECPHFRWQSQALGPLSAHTSINLATKLEVPTTPYFQVWQFAETAHRT